MKNLARIIFALWIAAVPNCAHAQQATNVQKDKDSKITGNLTIGSGKTLTVASGGSIIAEAGSTVTGFGGGGGNGTVTGSNLTAGNIVTGNGTTAIKASGATIDASNNFVTSGNVTANTLNGNVVSTTGTVTTLNVTNVAGATANGQLLIGNATSGNFTKGTLTAGSNVTITNSAGGITIASSGGVAAPTVNAQTGTSYTLVLGDANNIVTMSNASANTLTIPLNASVAFPTGTVIAIQQGGAGTTTVAPTGGVTLNGASSNIALGTQYQWASLVKLGTDTWSLAYATAGGGGGGSGTVTSVALSGSNGVSVSGSPITTNGTITVGLGDITPSSVNGIALSGASTPTLSVTGTSSISGSHSGTSSGTNTGDQTITLTGDVTGSGNGSFAATIANGAVSNAKLANSSITIGSTAVSLGSSITALAGITTIGASGAVTLSNTTESSSVGTGALVLSGGASVAKNLNVGGNFIASGYVAASNYITTSNYAKATNFWGASESYVFGTAFISPQTDSTACLDNPDPLYATKFVNGAPLAMSGASDDYTSSMGMTGTAASDWPLDTTTKVTNFVTINGYQFDILYSRALTRTASYVSGPFTYIVTKSGLAPTIGYGYFSINNANGFRIDFYKYGFSARVNVIASNQSERLALYAGAATSNGLFLEMDGTIKAKGNTTITGTLAASNFSGTSSGTNTGDQTITLTGDLTGSGTGSFATTLSTVNSNVGTFGNATQAPAVTVNGKGLITAVSNVTVTPAVGSITGLGTGVSTALGTNVGSAGSFVTNGGALGTPSSGTLTNATGLPISTGISGLGTGVATALGANVLGSGNIVLGTSPTITTPTLSGNVTQDGANIASANALGALSINVGKFLNTKSIAADSTFTFSATPSSDTFFSLAVTNTDTAAHTVTIPSSYSVAQAATITSVSIPASGKMHLQWRYDGSTYWIYGDPIPVSGAGTVTSFSSGNLTGLFTTSVASATSTPALSFTLSNQNANIVLAGPTTGAAAAPTFRSLVAADLPTIANAGLANSTITLGNTSMSLGSTTTNVTGLNSLTFGTPAFSDTDYALQGTANVNSYYQIELINTNAGTTASTDISLHRDGATATTNYIDLGINSSGFTGSGSLSRASAGYLYTQSDELVVGTNANKAFTVVTNGTDRIVVTGAGATTLSGASTFSSTINQTDATAATAYNAAALITAGGIGAAKDIITNGNLTATNGVTSIKTKVANKTHKFLNNFSTASQSPTAATRTYITGSNLAFTAGDLVAGTVIRWRFNMTKTAAGTAASTFDIAFGTAGTTADTARVSFTKPAGTAVVDEAWVEVSCVIRSVGASGVANGEFKLAHNLSATGHATIPNVVVNTTSAGFDTTTVTNVGLCITSGTADAITIQQCTVEAVNL